MCTLAEARFSHIHRSIKTRPAASRGAGATWLARRGIAAGACAVRVSMIRSTPKSTPAPCMVNSKVGFRWTRLVDSYCCCSYCYNSCCYDDDDY